MAEATYTIKSGDTLSAIARKYNVPLADLIAANSFRSGDPNLIYPGEVVTIPGSTGTGTGTGTGTDTPTDTGDTDPAFEPAVIPSGAKLVGSKNARGEVTYYAVYEYGGVEWAMEIGDEARLKELFGGRDFFDSYETVGEGRFGDRGYVMSGPIDDVLGSDESWASLVDGAVREAGLEDIPQWIRDDPTAMALVAEATADEWSPGRLWAALSDTDGFRARFPAIDRYTTQGMTVSQAVDEYVRDESAIRSVIRRYMPPGTDISTDYLAEVITNGWTPNDIPRIMDATERIRRDPVALEQANLIMTMSGLPTLDAVGMINVLTGGAPPDVIEALNTANAGIALANAGLTDIDIDLLIDVVDDTSTLLTPEAFSDLARDLSVNLIRNARDLDFERFGLTEEDLVAAAFGRESPSGRTVGETLNMLNRLEQERRINAQGETAAPAFIDDRDRLRIQGTRAL